LILDDSLGFILNNAGRKVSQLLSLRFQPFEITTEQWTLLNRLIEEDGISQKDLAKRVEKDQTNVTRILNQLERKGLVERETNTQDKRSFLTFVTEKGKKLNETLIPIENQVVTSVLEGLPESQIKELAKTLIYITKKANFHIQNGANRIETGNYMES